MLDRGEGGGATAEVSIDVVESAATFPEEWSKGGAGEELLKRLRQILSIVGRVLSIHSSSRGDLMPTMPCPLDVYVRSERRTFRHTAVRWPLVAWDQ